MKTATTSYNDKGILTVWLNWLIGSGSISLLVLLSLWVRPLWMPFVAFGLQFMLFGLIRRNRAKAVPSCYVVPFIVSRVMFWTAVVMVTINFMHIRGWMTLVFDPGQLNREIPFITILITSPIAAIISGWGHINRKRLSFCRDCKMRHGSPAERGFLGVLYTQMGQYQVGMLFWLSTISAVIGWTYYFFLYNNETLTLPDRFVFFWLPILLWFTVAIYIGLRCLGIWGYYRQNVEGNYQRQGQFTMLRYILIWDNYICVRTPEKDPDKMVALTPKFDTPIWAYISKQEHLSTYDAQSYLERFADTRINDVRLMYTNMTGNAECNIFHYLCFLTDKEKEEFDKTHTDCIWSNISELATLINEKLLNPLMAAEIVRLHTIGQTWKTYTPDGHKKYKVKHYKPAVQLNEIKGWDVDFNDSHWLYVADNNEDTPFYGLRKFWRKYVNGIGQ